MSSPVVTIVQETIKKNRIKKKIGAGSVVKEKVGETEENIRMGRHNSTRKEVVGCVQDVVGK